MSKANVAQEPSMDEILASIRRIIETGDEKTGGANREAVAGVARQIPAFLAGSQLHDAADVRDTGANPPSEARAPSFPTPLRFAPEPARHDTAESHGDDDALTAELETELAATWERIEVGREEGVSSAYAPEPLHPSNRGNDVMSNEPDMRPFSAGPYHGGHDQASVPVAPQPSPSNSYEAPMERTAFEPANTDARAGSHAGECRGRRAAEEQPTATSRYGDTPPPLVSPATGQLVHASFNELAEAIRQGELRSLETMAQEMLQPMLRDWLDDNLPKMVERLIREEIERLARGGSKR